MIPRELFELEMLGGAMERRYRKARPEVETLPWGSFKLAGLPDEAILAGRKAWTGAAFQEHRTAAACTATLRALVEARAPLDLIAVFARFPLDEIVHVELCARMAMELGGATELWHEPSALADDYDHSLAPLLGACELVTRNFCVGEALSIPLLHGSWLRASTPLPRAILGRIVHDEAAHGIFGWHFLDWALPLAGDEGAALVRRTAEAAIGEIRRLWSDLRERPRLPPGHAHVLGWMELDEYLLVAERSLRERVLRPFAARGLQIDSQEGRKIGSPDLPDLPTFL